MISVGLSVGGPALTPDGIAPLPQLKVLEDDRDRLVDIYFAGGDAPIGYQTPSLLPVDGSLPYLRIIHHVIDHLALDRSLI